jgi:hypothetical protein
VLGILKRFSPDSARTENPVPTRSATQKTNLAPVDIFMLLILFLRANVFGFSCLKLKRS